jgi:hypothetical protein
MSVSKTTSQRRRAFARDPLTDQSLQHSVYDGMAFSAMAGGTAIRMVISLCFLPMIRETGQARRPMSARQFIYRVSGFNAFLGLMYDLVADSPKEKEDKAE